MAIGRKRIAEAVRAFAAECAAGTAPELGTHFGSPGCAMTRVGERLGSHGCAVAIEICDYKDARVGAALCALYSANDKASSEKRAAAVVSPLNALADALDPVQP